MTQLGRKPRGISASVNGKECLRKAKDAKDYTFEKIWEETGVGLKTVRKFFAGTPVDSNNARAIIQFLGLEFTEVIDPEDWKKVMGEAKPKLTSVALNLDEVCREMLEAQKRLTSNVLMNDEDSKFDRDQINVPLALVQQTKLAKRSGEFSPESGMKLYEPQYEEKQRFESDAFFSQRLKQGEGKTDGKRIALIGEPGAGKTTFLQTIAFWVLDNNLGLPILISLADLQGKDIRTHLLDTWLKQAIPEPQISQAIQDDFLAQVDQGRVWLLLDGLDEMTSDVKTRDFVSQQWVASQLAGWIAQTRVVVTCRLNVWLANINALEAFETYRLLNFNHEQVKKFIHNWFQDAGSAKGERLKTELDRPEQARIRDLVKNPLRLALLCSTWQRREGNLPDTKLGLYQKFVEEFYFWKRDCFPTTSAQRQELNIALGILARLDIDSGPSRFRLRESEISEKLGDPHDVDSQFYQARQLGWLNVVGVAAENPDEKVYAFFHPTFQEYFAALAVDDWHFFFDHKPHAPQQGFYRIFEPQWKEVILLWIGRPCKEVSKEQKEDFIKALLEFEDGCGGYYKHLALFLAAASLGEFLDWNTISRLDHEAITGDYSYTLASIILGEMYAVSFGYVEPETLNWSTLVSNSMSTAAIAAFKTIKSPILLDSLYLNLSFLSGNPKLGNSLEILRESKIFNPKLLKNITFAWAYFDNFNLASFINSYFHVTGVSKLDKNYINTLRARQDKRHEIICQIASLLGELNPGDESAINTIVDLIPKIKNRDIHWLAVKTLNQIGGSQDFLLKELSKLITSTKNGDRLLIDDNFWQAFREKEKILNSLIKLTNTLRDENTLGDIISIFENIGVNCEEVIDALIKVLQIKNEEIRWNAICTLQKVAKGNTNAFNHLTQLTESKDESTQLLAILLLGISNIEFHSLLKAINNLKKEEISCLIKSALGQINKGDKQAIKILVKLINKAQNENYRRLAIVGLECIAQDSEEAILALIELIEKTTSLNTCNQAISSLNKIYEINQNQSIINGLVKIINETRYLYNSNKAGQLLKKILSSEELLLVALTKNGVNHPVAYTYICYLKYNTYENVSAEFKTQTEIQWHCAQRLNYPDFYKVWHHLSIDLDSKADPIDLILQGNAALLPRESLRRASLESHLASIKSTVNIYYLCVKAEALVGETNIDVIAKGLCNRIFYQAFPHEMPPKIDDASDLERWLVALKQRIQQPNFALILYGCEPQPELIRLCRKLTDFLHILWITEAPLDPPLEGLLPNQPNLVSAIQGWLKEIV